MKNLKVALVHDYLREYGGAERVLETLHEIFPEAPIYTAYLNWDGLGVHAGRLKSWNIKTSWLQYFPFANRLVSPFRIFAPKIFESFDLSEYDLVISSCAIYFAKAVKVKPDALHISYIHTPPHYLYGYVTSFNYKKHWWTKIGGEIINHFLRISDFETSQRPDILVANSKNVQERIKKFYRRDSVVVYPPVDLPVILSGAKNLIKKGGKKYFLALNRLVRGKGTEIIVEACTKLGLPLKVVGTGPELESLKVRSEKGKGKSVVEFLGEVKDEELSGLYSYAKALIVASEDEDFGITAVEAQAAGTPVIAIKSGGFLETVVEGKTGEFFDGSVDSLVEVLKEFNPTPRSGASQKYKKEDLIKNAEKFSKEKFKKEILELIKGLDKGKK